jgi:hypothetical protein
VARRAEEGFPRGAWEPAKDPIWVVNSAEERRRQVNRIAHRLSLQAIALSVFSVNSVVNSFKNML